MIQYNTIPPFITFLQFNGKDYLGIIKIKSKQYTTLYSFDLMSDSLQDELLGLAHDWWWQSNRSIPICLFFQEEMEKFEPYTQRFDTSLVNFVSGPVISLSNLPTKRIKRRNIALKKKK